MKIAVVDDYRQDMELLVKHIKAYFNPQGIDIDCFESGEQFLTEFAPDKYTLAFLDIYIGELTGVDIARQVFAQDKECRIVFITTSNSFASESYEVCAAGYLIKPVSAESINSLLDRLTATLNNGDKYMDWVTPNNIYHIAYRDIVYAESVARTVKIHLYGNIIELNEGFYEKTAPLLNDSRFLECCRGVIVNMDHIIKIQGDDFVMDIGEAVPIRKRHKKEIHRAYMKYSIGEL